MSKCEICEKREATQTIKVCDVCYNELLESQEVKNDKSRNNGT